MKGGGEPGLPLRQKGFESLDGLVGAAEAGELAHGPQPAAIAARMNAARVGKLTREREIAVEIESGDIVRRREWIHFHSAAGGEVLLPRRLLRASGPCPLFFAHGVECRIRK